MRKEDPDQGRRGTGRTGSFRAEKTDIAFSCGVKKRSPHSTNKKQGARTMSDKPTHPPWDMKILILSNAV